MKATLSNRLYNRVELIQIYETEVMLAAPTVAVHDRIGNEFRAQLATAWERELVHPVSIVVTPPFNGAAG